MTRVQASALLLWCGVSAVVLAQRDAVSPREALDRAVSHFEAGRIEESVAAFDAVVRLAPNQAPTYGSAASRSTTRAATPTVARSSNRIAW